MHGWARAVVLLALLGAVARALGAEGQGAAPAGSPSAQTPAAVAPAAAAPADAPGATDAPAFALQVIRAQLLAEGAMLEVRFTVRGATRLPVEPAQTYVVDEGSGERLLVANLVRVGPMAQRRKRAEGSSFMIFDNRFGHLAAGARVSVVVGGLRQEHVVVE